MPLTTLDLDHVIPDELHMLLRITDVLIQNLINTATSDDRNKSGIPQSRVYHANVLYTCTHLYMLQILEGPMLKELIEAIRNCGVPFTVRIGKNGKK